MTPDKKLNLYVNPKTPEPHRFRLGFDLLMRECKRLGVKDAWIIAPAKGSYDGLIAQAIGASQAKALTNKKPVKCGDVQVHGHYATRLPSIGDSFPVLAAYLSADSLKAVDALFSVPSLVVVDDDVATQEWRAKRQPQM